MRHKLPPNGVRQSGHQEAEHDHGAAEAHAEDDVVGEALPDVLRPLDHDGGRKSQKGDDKPDGRAPAGGPGTHLMIQVTIVKTCNACKLQIVLKRSCLKNLL